MQPPTPEPNQAPQQPDATLYQRAKATTAQVSNHPRVRRIATALNLPVPWFIGLSVAAVLVVCSCCGLTGLVGMASALNPPASAQATRTATSSTLAGATVAPSASPTAQATATATATATLKPTGPQPIASAVLGGTESAFAATYGSPTQSQSVRRGYEAPVAGQSTFINASLTQDGNPPRFWSLIISPDTGQGAWNATTAAQVAKALIPGDAKYVKDIQVPDFGLEHVYVSKSLAASFPASQFTDANTGESVTPGTFYVSCGNQTSNGGGCTIQTGQ